jgi:hypothetical protein
LFSTREIHLESVLKSLVQSSICLNWLSIIRVEVLI